MEVFESDAPVLLSLWPEAPADLMPVNLMGFSQALETGFVRVSPQYRFVAGST